MADEILHDDHACAEKLSCGAAGQRRRRCLLLAAIALLVGAGMAYSVLRKGPSADVPMEGKLPAEVPFEGKLLVGVRPVATAGIISVDEAGALPVLPGGPMHLEVRYTQPAHTYLVWIDCQGKAVPLYPWNMDDIESEDLNVPAPQCMATKFLISPMTIGKGWTFGKGRGLETVLLMARRTPLGQDMRLGDLIGQLPPAKMRNRTELSVLGIDPESPALKTLVAVQRGTAEQVLEDDAPLLALMEKLHKHFELIRVVRFAHDGP